MTKLLKVSLTTLFICLTISLIAQEMPYQAPVPVDDETGKIVYRDVIQEKGHPDSLYLRAIHWINQTFTNPSDVTRVRDRDNGLIRGTARMTLSREDQTGIKVNAGLVEYTFTIECRPDRYRYTFFDFIYKQTSRVPVERWLDRTHPSWNPMMDDYLMQINDHANKQIDGLLESMKEKTKVVDDW